MSLTDLDTFPHGGTAAEKIHAAGTLIRSRHAPLRTGLHPAIDSFVARVVAATTAVPPTADSAPGGFAEAVMHFATELDDDADPDLMTISDTRADTLLYLATANLVSYAHAWVTATPYNDDGELRDPKPIGVVGVLAKLDEARDL